MRFRERTMSRHTLYIYSLVSTIWFLLVTSGEAKGLKLQEVCPEVCEPEKCPNVGPIGLSQCPAQQYIVTYRCGCCKRCDVNHFTTTLSPDKRNEVCEKMTCPRKKVCVMNQQGLPVCKCPTVDLCKKLANRAGKKFKVCGSDGITYPSRCHLKAASCASDGKIRVAKKGECGAAIETSTQRSYAKDKTRSDNNRSGGRRQNSGKGNSNRQGRREDKKQHKKLRRREKNYQRALKSGR